MQPLFVIVLAPVFAWLWLAMGAVRGAFQPRQIHVGTVVRGTGLRDPGARRTHDAERRAGGDLVADRHYFLQTIGELCLSPVGLSAMTKLAPERAAGFMMGIWFLSISIGNWLAGKAASLYSSMSLPTLFGSIAAFTIGAAVVLALLIKPTVRLMGGVK